MAKSINYTTKTILTTPVKSGGGGNKQDYVRTPYVPKPPNYDIKITGNK